MHSLLKEIAENVSKLFLAIRETILLFTVVLFVIAMGLALNWLVIATKMYLQMKDYVISNGLYMATQEMVWLDEEIVFSTI